jgi:chitinase
MRAISTLLYASLLGAAVQAVPHHIKRAAADGMKLTVYWGAEDDTTTLADVCNDSSYEIVNLAFLNYFVSGGGYPSMSIGSLPGPSAAQSAAGATGLQDGSSLVSAIKACQSSGKLVILSLGGAQGYADVTLTSDSQGQQIANTLWNLFLGGTEDSTLRPFGSLKLDGVDIGMYTHCVEHLK